MAKIKELYVKYKEVILYLIFGGLTTVVSFVSFWLCDLALGVSWVSLSEFISWVAAVIFAYVVNKLFVFESKSWKPDVLKKEIPPFVLARVFSYLIEWGGIILLVYPLDFEYINLEFWGFTLTGSVLAKLILSVIVVIMNYFFSKFIIFKKKKDNPPCENEDDLMSADEKKSAAPAQSDKGEQALSDKSETEEKSE